MHSQELPTHATTEWWRIDRVAAETGLGKSTIYRMVANNQFPKARVMKQPRATIWLQSEIEEWKANALEDEPLDVSDLL